MSRPTDSERFSALRSALFHSEHAEGVVGNEVTGALTASLIGREELAATPFARAEIYVNTVARGLGYKVEIKRYSEQAAQANFRDQLRDKVAWDPEREWPLDKDAQTEAER